MTDHMIYHHVGKDAHFKVWHTLEHAMLIYTYSEGGSLVCGERSCPIGRGMLCFVGAGRYHYTMPDDPETYDRSKLFVDPQRLRGMLELLGEEHVLQRFSDDAFVYAQIPRGEQEAAEAIIRAAAEEGGERCGEAALLAAFLRLLILVDRYSRESTPSTSGLMSRAVAYINRNLFLELDIDGICAAIHVSKYHFCRAFKRRMGMTVMEYVLKTRIVMAKNMLAKERLSVTEVSNRCGFSSPAYFCRVFKQDTGMTPRQYRKRG